MIHPSKLCFNRHPSSPRARLSKPYRLAFLLLLFGCILIFAPWVTNRDFSLPPLETLPIDASPLETSETSEPFPAGNTPRPFRRAHRRQLLSSPLTKLIRESASTSVAWLRNSGSSGKSLLKALFSSGQQSEVTSENGDSTSASTSDVNVSAVYAATLDPLHMRRHVRPDYFEPAPVEGATADRRGNTRGSATGSATKGSATAATTSGTSTSNELCVAIATTPRVFPERRKLPSWHFPVSLLHMLEERRSPADTSAGFKDMRTVVYSSGCDGRPAAASAKPDTLEAGLPADMQILAKEANQRQEASPLAQGSESAIGEELAERKRIRASHAGAVHQRALKAAGRTSSLNVTVLPSRNDACDFVNQDEEALVKLGVMASDGFEAWRWRTKLVMDFVYVMRKCMSTRPKYVLLLQDDTRPAKLYDIGIERFINEDLKGKEWSILSLYYPQSYNWQYRHASEYLIPCCAQALLFNVSALDDLLGYVEEHFMEAPMDWLLSKYLIGSERLAYVHVPSLFQHVGDVRTKAPGVVSKTHKDFAFRDDLVIDQLTEAGVVRDMEIAESTESKERVGSTVGDVGPGGLVRWDEVRESEPIERRLREAFGTYPITGDPNFISRPETWVTAP